MSFCISCGKNVEVESTFCVSCGARKPLAQNSPSDPPREVSSATERDAQHWAMFLHLSVLAGFLIPLAGLVVPIMIWQIKKDQLPLIDAHGRNAMNWIISEVIYWTICFILTLGMPMAAVLGLLGIIFPVVAAIKGNNGVVWKYPLAIPFFRPSPKMV